MERRIDAIEDGRFDGTGFGRPPPPGEPLVDVDEVPMPPPPQFEMERRGMPSPEGGGASTR